MKGELIIVGLGPGPAGMLSEENKQAIIGADKVYAQTERHPVVSALADMGVNIQTLDDLYRNAQDFDVLNECIVETVLRSAAARRTAFAVNGHALTGQAAVADIIQAAEEKGINTVVYPALGLEAAAIAAAKLDASMGYAVHVGAVCAQSMDTSMINVVLDLDTKLKAGDVKIELMKRYADETTAYFVQTDENGIACRRIELSELDRQDHFHAFTALVLPARPLLSRQRFTAADLVEICRILRAPQGCPWDREQTHISIRRNMMEECCEAMAAISEGDAAHLCEELGDVLLQVALHAQIASEEGDFGFLDVTTGICEKMLRRHPHIFGEEKAETSADVLNTWERIKQQERNGAPKNPLQKVGEGLPALMRSQELQRMLNGIKDADFVKKTLNDAIEGVLNSPDPQIAQRYAGEALWMVCLLFGNRDVHAETALHDRCAWEVERHRGLNGG